MTPAPGIPAPARGLRDAAAQLVSSALLQPALESLHDSPLRPARGPFAINAAEKRFAPLLEQCLADNIVQASSFTLVDSIVERFSNSDEKVPWRNESASGAMLGPVRTKQGWATDPAHASPCRDEAWRPGGPR